MFIKLCIIEHVRNSNQSNQPNLSGWFPSYSFIRQTTKLPLREVTKIIQVHMHSYDSTYCYCPISAR